ncbi:MAG TPA: hypothetical protein VH988_30525, partial [Thermoanaerobaculia bacterium]|nr:hypothetical protein [Thermoanaerobaculia bacterium]
MHQRGHKPAPSNPPSQQKTSQFAPRPFGDPKKAPATANGHPNQQGKLDAEEELLQKKFDTGAGEPEQEPFPIQRNEPKPRIYSAFQGALGEPVQRVVRAGAQRNEVVCDDINDISELHVGTVFTYEGSRYTIDASFRRAEHEDEKNIRFTINPRARPKSATYAGAKREAEEIAAELEAHADARDAAKAAKLAQVLAGIGGGARPQVIASSYRHNRNGDRKSAFVGAMDNAATDAFIA